MNIGLARHLREYKGDADNVDKMFNELKMSSSVLKRSNN